MNHIFFNHFSDQYYESHPKLFSGAPPPNPNFSIGSCLSRFSSSIRYSHEISKNSHKIQVFLSENVKIFPGVPPTDLKCFSPKSFHVGTKNKRSGGGIIFSQPG